MMVATLLLFALFIVRSLSVGPPGGYGIGAVWDAGCNFCGNLALYAADRLKGTDITAMLEENERNIVRLKIEKEELIRRHGLNEIKKEEYEKKLAENKQAMIGAGLVQKVQAEMLKDISDKDAEIMAAQQQINQLGIDLEQARADFDVQNEEKEKTMIQMKKDAGESERVITGLQKESADQTSKNQQLHNDVTEMDQRLRVAKDEVKAKDAELANRVREISKRDEAIADLRQEVGVARAENSRLRLVLGLTRVKHQEATKQIAIADKDIDMWGKRLAGKCDELEYVQGEAGRLKEELESVHCNLGETTVRLCDKAKELDEAQERWKGIEERLEQEKVDLNNQIESIKENQSNVNVSTMKIQDLQQIVGNKTLDIAALEKKLESEQLKMDQMETQHGLFSSKGNVRLVLSQEVVFIIIGSAVFFAIIIVIVLNCCISWGGNKVVKDLSSQAGVLLETNSSIVSDKIAPLRLADEDEKIEIEMDEIILNSASIDSEKKRRFSILPDSIYNDEVVGRGV